MIMMLGFFVAAVVIILLTLRNVFRAIALGYKTELVNQKINALLAKGYIDSNAQKRALQESPLQRYSV